MNKSLTITTSSMKLPLTIWMQMISFLLKLPVLVDTYLMAKLSSHMYVFPTGLNCKQHNERRKLTVFGLSFSPSTTVSSFFCIIYFLSILKKGREKERENHWSAASCTPSTENQVCNPVMCPNQELNHHLLVHGLMLNH